MTYENDPLVAYRRSLREPGHYAGFRPIGAPSKRRSPTRRNWDGKPFFRRKRVIVAAAVVAVVGAAWFFWHRSGSISVSGLRDGMSLGRTAVDHRRVGVRVGQSRGTPTVTVNGVSIGEPSREGAEYVWHLPNLADGTYRFEVATSRLPFGTSKAELDFTVDSKAPVLDVPAIAAPAAVDKPFTLDGRVSEKATVTADGASVDVSDNTFHLHFALPPIDPITIKAVDAAGNTATSTVVVPVSRPLTNGVHMTAVAWTNDDLRNEVLGLIQAHKINSVELDLKDELGEIGYDSKIPLANEIGATKARYPLVKTVADLHAMGVRVIGRVVAFRDPLLTKAMWDRGQKDWVVQDAKGRPLGAYGGFANFASPDVQAYNLAVAEEGAKAGVDEILWDYVRRPEGPIDSMAFPGIPSVDGAVTSSVVQFLAKGQTLLRPLHVLQGASVFGIAATRPSQVGQDVAAIAMHTDYVAPMVYPSHWNRGEYGVPDPNRQPYDIVKASLGDFITAVAPSGRPLVPWLQDFTENGVPYSDPQVQDQIRAANELGVNSWLLWNPDTLYTMGTLPPMADTGGS